MNAVRATFGADASEVERLTLGLSSADVFRVVVRGRPYVVRKSNNPDPRWEPTAHFAAMRAAAEVGVAPRVHYASAEERLSIVDYIHPVAFPDDLTEPLATQLAALHALPLWTKRVDMFAMVDNLVEAGCALETAELFDRYREIRAVYRTEEDAVSSHNDLKWENMVWDGQQLWFVDWEAVFVNSRYFDLAVAGNFFARDEERYLAAYLGAPPTAEQRARALVVRVMCHVSYVTMFAMLATKAGAVSDGVSPDFHAFHADLVASRLDPRDPQVRMRYAAAHAAEALRLVRGAAFAEAVQRVR